MRSWTLALLLLVAPLGSRGRADPPVSIGAEWASSILEVKVVGGRVVLQLEIGRRDAQAFFDLLAGAGEEVAPLPGSSKTEHLARFFRERLRVAIHGGDPLVGTVRVLEMRDRTQRPSTFKPKPYQLARSQQVLYAEIEYEVPGRPARLSITPPGRENGGTVADLGFVAWHEGVRVIDFRFLSQKEVLHLDWDDPWYSKFENRNLKRHHKSPAMSFLYVEPTEIRHEILIRPRDMESWLDLGMRDKTWVEIKEQEALKQRVTAFLTGRNPVTVDGKSVELVLDRAHFLRVGLMGFEVIDPPERIRTSSALLGVIFRRELLDWPEEATVTWKVWNDRIRKVPAATVDEAGGLTFEIDESDPVSRWQNFLTNPSQPGLVTIDVPPEAPRLHLPLLSCACLLGVAGLLALRLRKKKEPAKAALAMCVILVCAAVLGWSHTRVSVPIPFATETVPEGDAVRLLDGLLTNVYRAFDHADRPKVYDVLARSTEGDLLSDLYFQTLRALEVRNQGGARVKVKTVEVESAQPEALDEGVGFRTRCTWRVSGSVGHWGHLHMRKNSYEADMIIRYSEDGWKLSSLVLLDETRL